MSKEFRALNIKFGDIKNLMECYCNIYGDGYKIISMEQNAKNPILYACQVSCDSKIATLNFYKNGDGTVTIQYEVGKNQEISKEIAEYIKLNGIKDDRKSACLSLNSIDEVNFNLLLEYIDELKVKIIENTQIPHGHKYKFKSIEFNDELTLIYYNSKSKLLIQGKPLYIYSEIISFLAEYMGFDEVIKSHSDAYNVNIEIQDVIDDMKSSLDHSYTFLGETLCKVLSPAFVFRRLEIQLDDYSAFVFPVLRTLEGYLKKILLYNDIKIKKSFYIFKRDGESNPYYIDDDKCEINCTVTKASVEEIYNFLSVNRHPMFHASYIADSTTIIEKREEADVIINNSLELIRRTHHSINIESLC